MAVKYGPGVDQHACRFMSTGTRPSLGRHMDRVSVEISAKCWSPYQPIVSTDTRSTDAFNTHNPIYLGQTYMYFSVNNGWYILFGTSLLNIQSVLIILYVV